MARVSVLMSCYGTGRWLWEALDSLPWDMPGLEVWVTANGDAPQDVAAVALAERTRPIRAIYRDVTLPLSGSLNVMLARAAGDYVMRLDCDDKLPEGALEAMLAAADAAPRPCIVYGGWVDFGGRERVVEAKPLARVASICPGADNLLMDTRLAREIGGWEEIGYEDWHLYAKLSRYPGLTAVMLDAPVLLHRWRADGRYAQMVADNDAHVAAIREALL